MFVGLTFPPNAHTLYQNELLCKDIKSQYATEPSVNGWFRFCIVQMQKKKKKRKRKKRKEKKEKIMCHRFSIRIWALTGCFTIRVHHLSHFWWKMKCFVIPQHAFFCVMNKPYIDHIKLLTYRHNLSWIQLK